MANRFKDFANIALTTNMGDILKNTSNDSVGNLGARVFYQDTWSTRVKGVILFHPNRNMSYPAVNSGYVTNVLAAGYILVFCKHWDDNSAYRVNDQFPSYGYGFSALEQQSYIEFVNDRLRQDPVFSPLVVASTRYFLCGDGDGARQNMAWSMAVNHLDFHNWRDLVLGIYANVPIAGQVDGAYGWSQVTRVMRAQANACASITHPCKVIYPIADTRKQVRTISELVSVSNGNPLVEIDVFGDIANYDENWVNTYPATFMAEVVRFANTLF